MTIILHVYLIIIIKNITDFDSLKKSTVRTEATNEEFATLENLSSQKIAYKFVALLLFSIPFDYYSKRPRQFFAPHSQIIARFGTLPTT